MNSDWVYSKCLLIIADLMAPSVIHLKQIFKFDIFYEIYMFQYMII